MNVAIDIETEGLDATKFILGTIKIDRKKKIEVYEKKEEMWERIKEIGKKEKKRGHMLNVYAHNMCYDFYGIANIKEKGLVIFSHRPFIAGLRNEKGEEYVKFLDTMGLFRMSLKEAGELIGEKKKEMPKGLKEGKSEKEELIEYCKRDSEVCLKLVETAKKYCKKNKINVKRLYTTNQIAINAIINYMRKEHPDERLFWDERKGELRRTLRKKEIHGAYRGGRVEAFKTGVFQNTWVYDVNSLYPYCAGIMRFPNLKTERKIWYPLKEMSLYGLLKNIGVSRAIIKNIDNDIGLMPIRTPEGSYVPKEGKVMIGTWTNQELNTARRNGYEILDIEWSVIWEDLDYNPIRKYMNKLYEKRKESKGYENYFIKSLMNGAIGKFAQTRAEQEYIIDSVEEVDEYLKRSYDIIQGIGTNYLYKIELPKKTKRYYCPIIPTLINAEARIILFYDMKQIGKEKILYTDTDSIVTIGDQKDKLMIGNELGDYKIENEGEECIIYGKKTWAIGEKVKISGIHKKKDMITDFKKGKVKDKKMITLKTKGEGTIGTFIDEERDLKRQEKQFRELQKKYEEQLLFIDCDIKDITYFLPKIEKEMESLIK